MHIISDRKALQQHFQLPLRTNQLRRLAKDVMSDFRYSHEQEFIQALIDEGIIHQSTLKARNGKTLTLYSFRSLDEYTLYQLAVSMFPNGYFCNLTSLFYHSLTDQVPSTVYVCNETIQPRGNDWQEAVPEAKIQTAFIKSHRHTNYIFNIESSEVIVLDRERGSDHGVVNTSQRQSLLSSGARVTGLERALIDAVVSPHYNGGITSLPSYFMAAKRRIRGSKLIETYRDLRFVYPYAQSIGFFLENAGMRKRAAEIRDAFPPRKRFFVDHNAKATWIFNAKWMLYHPRGLVNEN